MTGSKFYIGFLLVIIATGCKSQPTSDSKTAELLEMNLLNFKKKEKVPGLAFALFDNENIIWQQCLGNSSYGYPIDKHTLFSIQSISKNITATAIIIGVQDGILNLDNPISEYLPEFNINSCFEENSEEIITLRMLLTHTSGLTHEAPVGNNYDYTACSFEEHLHSISGTWLKFHAGKRYSYSNLGYDIAASIIEKVSGMTCNEYLKTRLFKPLEMNFTTIDDDQVLKSLNKTEGNMRATRSNHLFIPLIGSGAVYTNLSDFIKYVQLHMNFGTCNNKEFIERAHLLNMYSIKKNNYGLGTYIDKVDQVYFINHNGSGYGYSASFVWFPEFNIGAVLMCNKQVNTFDICISILNEYKTKNGLLCNSEVTDELNYYNDAYFTQSEEDFVPYHCTTDATFKDNWSQYLGKYSMVFKGLEFKWYARLAFSLGYHPQIVIIEKKDQRLCIRSNYGESYLREYKAGLFFTAGGEVVDFNSITPTYKNIQLKKIK